MASLYRSTRASWGLGSMTSTTAWPQTVPRSRPAKALLAPAQAVGVQGAAFSAATNEDAVAQTLGMLQQQVQQLGSQVEAAATPEGLQAAAGTAGKAAADALQLAAAFAQAAATPFNVFGSWGLNLLFFGVLVTLAYSLIVVAPRQ